MGFNSPILIPSGLLTHTPAWQDQLGCFLSKAALLNAATW